MLATRLGGLAALFVLGVGIDTIEQAPFLSAAQKRDIFYNNAARFLRLSPEELRRQSSH